MEAAGAAERQEDAEEEPGAAEEEVGGPLGAVLSLARRGKAVADQWCLEANQYEADEELQSSPARDLAKHPYFVNATLVVICFNALWIGADTQWNATSEVITDSPIGFQIVENIFCAYFTFELIVRFAAFRRKRNLFADGWFYMDTFLLGCMILETWAMRIIAQLNDEEGGSGVGFIGLLRLLRLLRLTRMTRLMRAFPAFLILVRSMVSAVAAVTWTLVLLLLLMYVFAIVYTSQLSSASGPGAEAMIVKFGTLGDSMLTLLTYGILCDELTSHLQEMLDYNLWYCLLFIVFILLSSITILNMLLGILCTVVTDSAKQELDSSTLENVRSALIRCFLAADTSNDGMISQEEFLDLANQKEAKGALESLNIDPQQLLLLSSTLFCADPDEEIDEDGRIINNVTEDADEPGCEERRTISKDEVSPVLPGSASTPNIISKIHSLQMLPDGEGDPVEDVKRVSLAAAARRTRTIEGADGQQKKCTRKLNFEEFVESIIALRPDTPASVLDIQSLKKQLRFDSAVVEKRLQRLESALEECFSDKTMMTIAEEDGAVGTFVADAVLDSGSPIQEQGNRLSEVPSEVLFSLLRHRMGQEATTAQATRVARAPGATAVESVALS